MKHLPVAGFHCFRNGVDLWISGYSHYLSAISRWCSNGHIETVTFFNEMCCMAPAYLIDKRIVGRV